MVKLCFIGSCFRNIVFSGNTLGFRAFPGLKVRLVLAQTGLPYLWRVVLDGPPQLISDRARMVLVNLHVNLAENLVPKQAEVRAGLLRCPPALHHPFSYSQILCRCLAPCKTLCGHVSVHLGFSLSAVAVAWMPTVVWGA